MRKNKKWYSLRSGQNLGGMRRGMTAKCDGISQHGTKEERVLKIIVNNTNRLADDLTRHKIC